MANIKLGGTTALTESSGTVTLDNAVQDNITRLGTVTSANIDAVSDVVKLYSNTLSSASASIEIDGYFDDTKYACYRLLAVGLRSTASAGNVGFRVMTGGSVNTSSIYWSAGGGNYSDAGGANAMTRADNDGANFAYADCTWSPPYGGSTATLNYEIIFAEPQHTTYHKQFRLNSWSDGHATTDNYTRIEQIGISARIASALTGVNLYALQSTLNKGQFTLYGYRK